MLPGVPRENDVGHASAGGSTLCEVAAKIVERDAVASRQLRQTSFDGGERRRIREYFCGLFKRFVPTTLSQPSPPTWDYVMLENHPTIMQRIAMAQAWRSRRLEP